MEFLQCIIVDPYSVCVGASASSSESPHDQLLRAMSDLPPASYPHMLCQLRDSLLATAALHLPNVSYLLNAETSTRQAQSIIGSAAIGAGWRLPLDLSAVYDIDGESYAPSSSSLTARQIIRIKPLKDVTIKEAAYYCHIKRMQTVNWRRWDTFVAGGKREKPGVRSLERLTEGEALSSVGAICVSLTTSHVRLHHRIACNPPSNGLDHLSNRFQARFQGWQGRSRSSVSVLWHVSLNLADRDSTIRLLTPYSRPAESTSTSLVDEREFSADEAGLAGMLCYACRTTFAPVLDTPTSADFAETPRIPLPTWVEPRIARRQGGDSAPDSHGAMSMESMKKVVDEFLIQDE